MAKAKILINDFLGRFKEGEIGDILECDFNKYDYKIDLGPVKVKPFRMFDKIITEVPRVFYFFKSEIEVIDETP